jgi:hypothetical protein
MDSDDKVIVAITITVGIVMIFAIIAASISEYNKAYLNQQEMIACIQKAPITQCKEILK